MNVERFIAYSQEVYEGIVPLQVGIEGTQGTVLGANQREIFRPLEVAQPQVPDRLTLPRRRTLRRPFQPAYRQSPPGADPRGFPRRYIADPSFQYILYEYRGEVVRGRPETYAVLSRRIGGKVVHYEGVYQEWAFRQFGNDLTRAIEEGGVTTKGGVERAIQTLYDTFRARGTLELVGHNVMVDWTAMIAFGQRYADDQNQLGRMVRELVSAWQQGKIKTLDTRQMVLDIVWAFAQESDEFRASLRIGLGMPDEIIEKIRREFGYTHLKRGGAVVSREYMEFVKGSTLSDIVELFLGTTIPQEELHRAIADAQLTGRLFNDPLFKYLHHVTGLENVSIREAYDALLRGELGELSKRGVSLELFEGARVALRDRMKTASHFGSVEDFFGKFLGRRPGAGAAQAEKIAPYLIKPGLLPPMALAGAAAFLIGRELFTQDANIVSEGYGGLGSIYGVYLPARPVTPGGGFGRFVHSVPGLRPALGVATAGAMYYAARKWAPFWYEMIAGMEPYMPGVRINLLRIFKLPDFLSPMDIAARYKEIHWSAEVFEDPLVAKYLSSLIGEDIPLHRLREEGVTFVRRKGRWGLTSLWYDVKIGEKTYGRVKMIRTRSPYWRIRDAKGNYHVSYSEAAHEAIYTHVPEAAERPRTTGRSAEEIFEGVSRALSSKEPYADPRAFRRYESSAAWRLWYKIKYALELGETTGADTIWSKIYRWIHGIPKGKVIDRPKAVTPFLKSIVREGGETIRYGGPFKFLSDQEKVSGVLEKGRRAIAGLGLDILPYVGLGLESFSDVRYGWFGPILRRLARLNRDPRILGALKRPLRYLELLGLGLSRRSTGTVLDIFKNVLLKRVLPLGFVASVAGVAFDVAGKDPLLAIYNLVTRAHVNFSYTFGLTERKRRLERQAPGSTDILHILSYPLATMTLTSVANYFEKVLRGGTTSEWAQRFYLSLPKKALGAEGWIKRLWDIGRTAGVRELLRYSKGRLAIAGVIGALPSLVYLARARMAIFGSKYTPEEWQRVLEGKKRVPIRKGRWWLLSSHPFRGTKVSYFRPHGYAIVKSRAIEKEIWGSTWNKWASNFFLNPFGAAQMRKRIVERHRYDRPYPVEYTPLRGAPFVGVAAPFIAGLTGEQRVYAGQEEGIKPKGVFDELRASALKLSEVIGLRGFVYREVAKAIFGEGRDPVVLADPSYMFSLGRRFYQWDFGDPFWTEFIRRVVPDPSKDFVFYNPMPNTMHIYYPWLPREYLGRDWTRGDIKSEVKMGDIRFPGRGYEAIHGPTDYTDPLVRLEILSGVAPYSEEYKRQEEIVRQMANMGFLTRQGMRRYVEATTEAEIVRRGKEFQERMRATKRLKVTVDEVLGDTFTVRELPGIKIKLDGLNMSLIALKAEDEKVSMALTYKERARKIRQIIVPGGQYALVIPRDEIAAFSGPRTISGVLFRGGTNINRLLVEEHLAVWDRERSKIPEMYGVMERGFLKFHDTMSQLNTVMVKKFSYGASAYKDYMRNYILGVPFATWSHPIRSYIRPWIRTWAHRLGLYKGVSKDVREQWAVEEYFDKLKYIKYKRLEAQAILEGRLDEAQKYRREWESTLIAAGAHTKWGRLWEALPSRLRPYFREFEQAESEAIRRKILRVVPYDVGRTLRARWRARRRAYVISQLKRRNISANERRKLELELERLARYTSGGRTKDYLQAYRQSHSNLPYEEWLIERELSQYFSRHQLPDRNSPIWDARIPMKIVLAKYLVTEGMRYHDYDVWEEHVRVAEGMDFDVPDLSEPSDDVSMIEEILGQNRQLRQIVRYEQMQSQVHIRQTTRYDIDIQKLLMLQSRDLERAAALMEGR
jgi:hypothetical protein